MSNWFKPATLSLFTIAICCSLTACGQHGSMKQMDIQAGNEMKQLDTRLMRSQDMGTAQSAKQLENRADGVTGVDKVQVVLLKKDAFVALTVNDRGKRFIIEKQVYAALKGQYPAYEIYVTSDEGLRKRISALHALKLKGAPEQHLTRDAAVIIRDINAEISPPIR
ncbi:YhcN/YlaJ family sporulation lipoprotein [Paenibacillus sinopodophylli]|uniref:YhcN/YlaJ family sporulation lipoprotein n=1 Tax=Paenibacillus sinopodophylli TaxID=1837342 RepID=UPI00110C9BB4|nr:YhcN/YlaJ family sporulation lipoprotein [Paenibacillus sinopodophylli]